MRFVVLCASFFLCVAAHAQRTTFYDSAGVKLPDRYDSYFYRQVASSGVVNRYIVKEFYSADNSKKLEAECVIIRSELIYDGTVTVYEPGGILMYMQVCDEGICKYGQYWVNSQPVLTNGSGVIEAPRESGNRVVYEFRDSLAAARFVIRREQNDSIYTLFDVAPSYAGGVPKFQQDVLRKTAYLHKGDERGKVQVEFVVGKTGDITEVKVIKSIGPKTKAMLEKRFAWAGKWSPALVQGKPVKTRMIQPIDFR